MPIDRPRRQRATPRPGGARAAILLATLLGIVGMHGIGSHGVHGSDAAHTAAMAHHATAVDGAVAAESPNGSMPSLLDVCCVAILVGLGFALWALQRRPHGPRRPDRTRQASPAFVARPSDRGPPTLAELSILRC